MVNMQPQLPHIRRCAHWRCAALAARSSSCHSLNVGGKLLTNLLKESLSYRQLDLMGESVLVNQVSVAFVMERGAVGNGHGRERCARCAVQMKEELCYVATDIRHELQLCALPRLQNPVWREFVLPDYSRIMRGFVKVSHGCDAGHTLCSLSTMCRCLCDAVSRVRRLRPRPLPTRASDRWQQQLQQGRAPRRALLHPSRRHVQTLCDSSARA